MADGYTISGAPRSQRNGRYTLLRGAECNSKPVYQMTAGGYSMSSSYVLFQPADRSYWMVGSSDRIADCDNRGWVSSNGGWCSTSPDGAGCAGLWRANTGNCGGSSWCNAPTLAVTPWCSAANPCCGVDCGSHGTLDAGNACSCSCTDGYSGDRCQLPPLPAGMAEGYTVSGASASWRNGRYVLAGECNGKPAYATAPIRGYALFQPSNQSYWTIGMVQLLAECASWGWAHSYGRGGSCPARPDGAGCAGLWQEWNSSVLEWQNATALAVSPG